MIYQDLNIGIKGIVAIKSKAPENLQELLAYTALYACRYSGNGELDKYKFIIGGSVVDNVFVSNILSKNDVTIREEGWTIQSWDDHKVFISKGGINAFINLKNISNNSPLYIGQKIELFRPIIETNKQLGFIIRQGVNPIANKMITRVYLNILPVHSNWVLNILTKILDEENVQYYLKVFSHPKQYIRFDSCVIYIQSEYIGKAISIIKKVIQEHKVKLSAKTPLFTKFIASGIGIADEPSDLTLENLSHGLWVSNLFYSSSINTISFNEIRSNVIDHVIKSGRNPEFPYLRKGRTDDDLE